MSWFGTIIGYTHPNFISFLLVRNRIFYLCNIRYFQEEDKEFSSNIRKQVQMTKYSFISIFQPRTEDGGISLNSLDVETCEVKSLAI